MPELPKSETMGGKMGETGFKAPKERGLPRVPVTWLLASFMAVGSTATHSQEQAASCAPVIARVVSLQGTVEVQRAGTANWFGIRRLDTSICAGDRLRTAPASRAALYVQPETLVRLDQNTTLTLQHSTDEISVEFSTDAVSRVTCSEQTCGAGYFITRFPKKFKVKTPHMNAAVEGTEFMVKLSSDATTLTVLEGKVSSEAVATQNRQLVAAGQSIRSGAGGAGEITAVVKPLDAVSWALHYPRLSDSGTTARAEELLARGSVDEALVEIERLISANPSDANPLALRAVIQIAKNDKEGAIEAAGRAIAADAGDYRGWLAISYVEQADFRLESALRSAKKAQSLQADSALAHARVAELELSLGDTRRAEVAAKAAVASNPTESHAHTILGFVHLSQFRTDAARDDFTTAIERDSFRALPRLGLGLAMIRQGNLTKGREQLEIAVALDPASSLIRSYVGKAYYEENTAERDGLAATQFQLAKQFDPQDPTSWYYDAFLNQSQNRPVDALHALQTSIGKNKNRAVYRSRLLIDADAAARTASVAAIYSNLGFEKLAIVESARALATDAGNHSAHQQLASAYASIPRHDIARVSEALQAQLRQPPSLASVGPLLNTDNLVISSGAGPARPGVNEFNALFDQDDVRIQFDGIAGGLDTFGDQFVASVLDDNVSYTLGQLHYETDGFTENDAAEKDVLDLVVHGQVSTQATVQIDLKKTEFSIGQTFFPFDEFPLPTTLAERSDTVRVSGHHVVDAGQDWIWSAAAEDRDTSVRSFPDGALFTRSNAEPYAVEVQHSGHVGEFLTVTGAGFIDEAEEFPDQQTDIEAQAVNVYAYGQWTSSDGNLDLFVGLAGEWFKSRSSSPFTTDRDPIDRNRISPKLGLIWSPRSGMTVRAAALSSVRRPFIRGQTIEPTQVAGFNQFFTGFEQVYGDFVGTVSDRVGLAFDQAFPSDIFGGAEITWRRLEVPSAATDGDFTWRERTAHLYFYEVFSSATHHWLPTNWAAAVSAELEYEAIDRPQILTGSEGIMELDTGRAPIAIQFFHDGGTTLRLAATYVRQKGEFSIDVPSPIVAKDDEAWITDIAIDYRLPRRKGIVSFGVKNVFDETLELLEIDPLNPRVATSRFAFGRFSIEF